MRRFFKKAAALVLLAALILMCGCGDSSIVDLVRGAQEQADTHAPEPAADISVTADSDGLFCLPFSTTDTLDPYACQSDLNRVIIPLIYDSLFVLDENYNFSNSLCESYSTEDNMMFSFKLRQAVFSDGSELTAADAAYSINAARESGSRFASRLSGIIACYVVDGELRIELARPNLRLPALLDIPICRQDNRSVGCGAYTVTGEGSSLTLKLNATRWKTEKMPYDDIYLKGYDSLLELIFAFGSKEIDLVTTDFTSSSALGYSGDYDIWTVNTPTMLYIAFNMEQPVFSVESSRQIFARGIDRQKISAEAYTGHSVATSLPVPTNSEYYNEQIDKTGSYSTAAISSIMRENDYSDINDNGYPDVETYYGWYDLNVDLVINAESEQKAAAAQIIHDDFAALGIEVTVKSLSYDEYISTIQSGDFYMYLGEVTLSPDFNLYKLMGSDGAMNYGHYDVAEANDYLTSGEITDDFLNFFLQSVPFTPILFKDSSVLLHRGAAGNIIATNDNVFYNMSEWIVN